jgi:hypothetical protein
MPNVLYIESELNFLFPESLKWEELDEQGVPLPKGLALVDLVIERDEDILIVEIKDPSDTKAKEKQQKHYIKRLKEGSVITEELTPKARDSYTFLHLMERDNKDIKYIVILGLDAFDDTVQKAVLSNFKDRLLGQIRKEAVMPWKRQYIKDCAVMTIETWNNTFSDWQITRVPEVGDA